MYFMKGGYCFLSYEVSRFSEEGENLFCNLSKSDMLLLLREFYNFKREGKTSFVIYETGNSDNFTFFPLRIRDFQKKGKRFFVIYQTVMCCFSYEISIFSEEGENLFCSLSNGDMLLFLREVEIFRGGGNTVL